MNPNFTKSSDSTSSQICHQSLSTAALFYVDSTKGKNNTSGNDQEILDGGKVGIRKNFESSSPPYARDPASCVKYYKCVPIANNSTQHKTVWYHCGFDYMLDEHQGICDLRSKIEEECMKTPESKMLTEVRDI